MYTIIAITALSSLILGSIISLFIINKINNRKANNIIEQAKKDGEEIKKNKIFQSKEKFLELKSEHEKVINRKSRYFF